MGPTCLLGGKEGFGTERQIGIDVLSKHVLQFAERQGEHLHCKYHNLFTG